MITMLDDQIQIDIERDLIEDTPLLEPDPKWEFTDVHGHKFKWKFFKNGRARVFGIREKESEEFPGFYQDVCRICGAVVEPGEIWNDFIKYKIGPTHYKLNGQPVSRQKAVAAMMKLRKQTLKHSKNKEEENGLA